jgi:hypothetical protein
VRMFSRLIVPFGGVGGVGAGPPAALTDSNFATAVSNLVIAGADALTPNR